MNPNAILANAYDILVGLDMIPKIIFEHPPIRAPKNLKTIEPNIVPTVSKNNNGIFKTCTNVPKMIFTAIQIASIIDLIFKKSPL